MKLSKRSKLLSLGVVGLAAAAGVGAVAVPDTTTQAKTSDADVVAMLRERSPGVRNAGAETSKFAIVPASATLPVLAPRPAVLGERDAAPVAVAAAPAPAAAVLPVPAPAVVAPQAVAAAPILVPAVAAPLAAAAASGPGLAAVLPFIPAALAIGGGGGGGGITTADIAPPIPEPKTWMMMITGFGLLGFALRRRRREQRSAGRAAPQPA